MWMPLCASPSKHDDLMGKLKKRCREWDMEQCDMALPELRACNSSDTHSKQPVVLLHSQIDLQGSSAATEQTG
jgi:hypothetical protein